MDGLLFQRSEEPLDDTIRFGFADEGVARQDAPEPDLLLAPLLELEDGNTELAGEELHALAPQQTQDDLALVRDTPALARRRGADFRLCCDGRPGRGQHDRLGRRLACG